MLCLGVVLSFAWFDAARGHEEGAIRAAFDRRRTRPGLLEGLARKLLGVDAKLAQYRDGAAFVRQVTELAGPQGFARVWEGPHALPSRAELTTPRLWVDRVGPVP